MQDNLSDFLELPVEITLIAVALIVFICVVRFARSLRQRSRARLECISAYLHAMRFLCTPTRSFWPQEFVALACSAPSGEPQVFKVGFDTLRHTVIAGQVELRDSNTALPTLLGGHLEGPGWKIQLKFDDCLKFRVVGWVLAWRVSPSLTKVSDAAALALTQLIWCFQMSTLLGASQHSPL